MFFLNPTYLWALLGLAVPIAIHLWSKKEGRTIKIGSIQLLTESNPKQTSNLKVNEWWLLLLRMLVISLLVLIMAAPQLKKDGGNVAVTYIIEPSLFNYDKVKAIIDTIEEGTSLRLLQSGFPELQKDRFEGNDVGVPNYWQLAKEMEGLPTDSIVVYTNAFISGFRGMRPTVNKNINWVVLDPGEPKRNIIEAVKKGEGVELVSVVSNHQNLSFEKEVVAINNDQISINRQKDSIGIQAEGNWEWLPLKSVDSLEIVIFYDGSLSTQMRYIKSAFAALATYLEKPINVQTVQEEDNLGQGSNNLLVWLSTEPVLPIMDPLLVFHPDSLANSLIEPGPSPDVFHLTRPLDPENIVEEHLPEQLLAILDLHRGLDEKIKAFDARVMDREELEPNYTGIGTDRKFSEILDISGWLWMLLLALLIAEKGLAFYRKQ